MRIRTYIGLFLALSIVVPPSTTAQTVDAREHFRRGEAAYRRGDYDSAIKEWRTAYETEQKPKIQYNLAQAYERLGRLSDAVAALKLYLETTDPDDAMYSDASARLASLQQRISLTGIKLLEGVDGATILVDDRNWGRMPRPDKIPLKPGSHRVVVQHSGYQDFVSNVVVAAGQVAEVTVYMQKLGEEGAPVPAETGQAPVEAAEPSAPADEASEAGVRASVTEQDLADVATGSDPLPWYIASGALGAVTLGSIIWTADRYGALSDCDDPNWCSNEGAISGQRTLALVSTVVFGLGAVGTLVYAIYLDVNQEDQGSANAACVPNSLTGASCFVRF